MVKCLATIFLITFALLFPNQLSAQALYESGYFIDVNNHRIDGLIDRSFLPEISEYIRFKKSIRDTVMILTPFDTKFVAVSGLKLASYEVDIDTSTNRITTNRKPIFEKKHVFLELLIDGALSLYRYKSEKRKLFFIKEDDQRNPTQLIYKQYYGTNGLYNNNTFRDQLQEYYRCSGKEFPYEDIKYDESELIQIIKQINDCQNYSYSISKGLEMHSARYLNISVLSGIRWSSVRSSERITSDELFVWKDLGLTNLGVEFEYLFSSTRNKIAPIIRLELARSSDESVIDLPLGKQTVEKHLDYLFLSFALRGYLTTNTATKFYADVGIATPIMIQDGISLNHEVRSDFSYSSHNWTPTVGVGLVMYHRFSLESKMEFFERKMSGYTDFNDITYTAFTVNLKVYLKSYYSIWNK